MTNRTNKTLSTRNLTEIAVITALLCVLGPLTIPIGPVPISLAPLAILLGVYILGMKRGTIACMMYLLIGTIGLPVFSGFSGGLGKLAGPTGGYLLGYIFLALIAGFFIDRFWDRIPIQIVGMVLGVAVLYTFGTIWLAYQAHLTPAAAFAAGAAPFIPMDLLKIAVAIFLGRTLRTRLRKAGVLS